LVCFVATNLLAKTGQRRYSISEERSDKEESAFPDRAEEVSR